jgi:FkbM family methyltransferase
VLHHGTGDDAWSLFHEIFLQRCYTGKGFYVPRAGDAVIDCGANIGFFAVYLKSLCQEVEIFCFEPCAATRERLSRNVLSNQLGRTVKILPFAIFNENKNAELCTSTFAGDSSIVFKGEKKKAENETIQCITLRDALDRCRRRRIQLLKIDVEGAELEILESATPEDFSRIERISLEYHEAYRPGCRDRLLKVLKRNYSKVSHWTFNTSEELGIMQASGNLGKDEAF